MPGPSHPARGQSASRTPDRQRSARYLRELADAMDDRTRRLGEHAGLTLPLWAGQALGPLPAEPAGRLGWEHRAGVIAAYRERYGHDHPADPVGAEPGRTSPEARAAWHGALASLGRVGGIDLRHLPDGDLWLRRGTYERETAWAPPHAAADLKLVRTAGRDAHVNALRAEHETRAARRRRQGRCRGTAARRGPGHPPPLGTGQRVHPADRDRRRHRAAPPPPRHADRPAPPAPSRSHRRQAAATRGGAARRPRAHSRDGR